jgi:lipopolysaccharide export system permease protein
VFIVTNVSFDELYSHNRGDRYCSTAELIRRIRMPSTASVSIRTQIIELHERLTRPLAGIVAVFVTIPLIVRREGVSLVENLAVCTAVLGVLLGVSQGAVYLGKVNLISPELAAWAPIIISGAVGAWLSSHVQT